MRSPRLAMFFILAVQTFDSSDAAPRCHQERASAFHPSDAPQYLDSTAPQSDSQPIAAFLRLTQEIWEVGHSY